MRRKSLWKQVLAVSLSVAMLVGLPAEAVFADGKINGVDLVETAEFPETPEDTEEVTESVDLMTETTEDVAEYFEYEENEDDNGDADGTVTITGYTGSDTEVVIPDEIDGKSVTGIGNSAFSECSSLVSIEIPDGVTSIGDSIFFNCERLQNVILPESLKNIGDFAFEGCKSLASITIPFGVTSIGKCVFGDCDKLISIVVKPGNSNYTSGENNNCIVETQSGTLIAGCQTTVIPEDVKIIGKSAFEGCTNLTKIVIPESVINIEEEAFAWCTGLCEITIPKNVAYIGKGAFWKCISISEIVVQTENDVYTSGENNNCIIEQESKKLIVGCQNTIIPNEVTSIGDYAFYICENLSNIVIPDGVTSIGKWAFGFCSGLTNVDIPDSVTSIGEYAFSNCYGLIDICIPKNITSIEAGTFSDCSGLTNIEIQGSVFSIGDNAFAHDYNLKTDLQLSETRTIGREAFRYCEALSKILLPLSVEYISYSAFDDCNNLTIYCADDSYARQYVVKYNIPYKSLEEWDASSCIHANTEIRNAKSATCTETGYTGDTYCIDCGELIANGTIIVALGHFYTESITTQPTVTSEGVKTYTCSRCGDAYTETIAKLNCAHTNTEVRNAKSATCTEIGYTGDTYCVDCGTLISSGTTIAKLTVTYTVKFDGNGANSGSMENQKITYASGKALSANKFKKKGYSFKGWNISKDGSGTAYDDKADASRLIETNGAEITLYAQWTANKYTITFNGNGSTSGSTKKLSNCKYGKKYTLTKNGFKKTGYTFNGWNTKKDGSGKSYKNKAEVKNLSSKSGGKVTLYVQWKKTKYTITYNLNKGKNNKNNPTSYNITTKTIKLKNPTRKGYTFKGWYSDKKCTKKVTQVKKGSTGNVTLYAKWTKK